MQSPLFRFLGAPSGTWTRRGVAAYLLPALVWMGVIFYVSHHPAPSTLQPVPDYILHGLAYGLLGALVFRAFWHRFGEEKPVMMLAFWAFAITVLYGISDEFHQWFIPTRQCSLRDVISDSVGGMLVIWILKKEAQKK